MLCFQGARPAKQHFVLPVRKTYLSCFCWFELSLLKQEQLEASSKPHIVFVLVKDWDFADTGFHNPAINTLHFDILASTSRHGILNHHYALESTALLLERPFSAAGWWPCHTHQYNTHPQNMGWSHHQHDHAASQAQASRLTVTWSESGLKDSSNTNI